MGPVRGGSSRGLQPRLDLQSSQTKGETVFIAILDFSTAPDDRVRALGQLESERPLVRSMPGNVAFRVYASREDDRSVTVVHEWDDQDSFVAYLASDAFARSNAVLRPLVTNGPVSRRFRAELVESVA
jgi:quinol monooxygenase YgiN